MNFEDIKTKEDLVAYVSCEKGNSATQHPLYDEERSNCLSAASSAYSSGDMSSYYGYMSAMSDIGRRRGSCSRGESNNGLFQRMNDLLPEPILEKEFTVLRLYRYDFLKSGDIIIATNYPDIGFKPVDYKFFWSKDGKTMLYLYGSTDDEIVEINEKLRSENLPTLPDDLAEFYKIAGGLEFNGMQIHGTNNHEILTYNIDKHDYYEGYEDYLFIGSIDDDIYLYNSTTKKYEVRDINGMEIWDEYDSFHDFFDLELLKWLD